MEEKASKSKRGGARAGSGRKKKPPECKRVRHTVCLKQEVIKTLQTLENYSAFVEDAILKEFKKRKIKLEN